MNLKHDVYEELVDATEDMITEWRKGIVDDVAIAEVIRKILRLLGMAIGYKVDTDD